MEDFFSLLTDPTIAFPILLTLKACAASGFLFIVVALPLAYYAAKHNTVLAKILLFVTTLPLIFPPVALGYLLLLLLGINAPLGHFLYEQFSVRVVFSQTGVVLAAFIAGLPLVIRPVKIAFESRTVAMLEEASRVCGAGPIRTFFMVTLPTVRNAILAALLLGIARSSGEVGITMMLGGNVADRTNTLSLEIFNAVGRGDFESATWLCLMLALVALVLYAALELIRGKSQI